MSERVNKFCYQRAMLIDENEIDLFIAQKILRSLHFAEHIEIISDQNTALMNLAHAKKLPDFIFLGLYSQYNNGFKFLEELQRLSSEVRRIRIVVLSISSFYADEVKAMEYEQVVAYLQKPLRPGNVELLCKK